MTNHSDPCTVIPVASPIPVAALSSMTAIPPCTLTQARTAASPLFLSGPPPNSPLYAAKATSSSSSPSSTAFSQAWSATIPSAGYAATPLASSSSTSAGTTHSSAAVIVSRSPKRPARAKWLNAVLSKARLLTVMLRTHGGADPAMLPQPVGGQTPQGCLGAIPLSAPESIAQPCKHLLRHVHTAAEQRGAPIQIPSARRTRTSRLSSDHFQRDDRAPGRR